MDKLLKFFPFLPEKDDGGKLAIALVFYFLAPSAACAVVGFVLGLTIILAPVGILVGLAGSAYSIMGIVFSIMKFCGKEIAPKQ